MKSHTHLTRQQRNENAAYYIRWMELNWCITFVTTCKALGLGKERARRLFYEIKKEMDRFNEYNDYEYSMKELNAELERLGIPYKTGAGTGGGAYYDVTYRDRMTKKNQAAASIEEARKNAEMLAAMKELL